MTGKRRCAVEQRLSSTAACALIYSFSFTIHEIRRFQSFELYPPNLVLAKFQDLQLKMSNSESFTQDIGSNQPIHDNMLEDIEVEELGLE
ncbi:hypothetical protein SASPL_114676 [Salvia splendens]|uniref:Uncharacterized protein n=1 Tax=Salvia splendens TaxID=180675 RepID=A0A8X8Y6Y0_SALSN|nr:hypothetical protein SASPL_114676 [Salvia splendens]